MQRGTRFAERLRTRGGRIPAPTRSNRGDTIVTGRPARPGLTMTLPSYDRFIEPLLRILASHPHGVSTLEVYTNVAEAMGLSEEDRAILLPSGGQAVYKNRLGWAHDRLKRGGLSSSPKRGFWCLTAAGLALAKSHPKLTEEQIERIADVAKDSLVSNPSTPQFGSAPPPSAGALVSPDERIEVALAELRQSVAQDLLERIGQAPPAFFESLVLDVLHKLGYGTSREDLQRVWVGPATAGLTG